MMKTLALLLALTACLGTPAWSNERPVHQETGTIAITLGDEKATHYTTSNTVPGDPDREVHTASWLILEPRLMGGINIVPDDVFVTITSRNGIGSEAGQASLRVEFSLDPKSFELKTKPAPSVRFYPNKEGPHFAMTEGIFELDSITRIDADTFEIAASARGLMTAQTGDTVTHNPKDAVEFEARLDLKKVVNRGAIALP